VHRVKWGNFGQSFKNMYNFLQTDSNFIIFFLINQNSKFYTDYIDFYQNYMIHIEKNKSDFVQNYITRK